MIDVSLRKILALVHSPKRMPETAALNDMPARFHSIMINSPRLQMLQKTLIIK